MHELSISSNEYKPNWLRRSGAGLIAAGLLLVGCGEKSSSVGIQQPKRNAESAGNAIGQTVGEQGFALVSKDTIGSIDGVRVSSYVYADPEGVEMQCTLAVTSPGRFDAGVSNTCNYDAYNVARAKYDAEHPRG